MNDIEIRLRCVEAAVHVPGNPNTLQQAREFYGFAIEGREEPVRSVLATAEGDIVNPTAEQIAAATGGKKGQRK